MKYFTKETCYENYSKDLFQKACDAYKFEYNKAKRRVPSEFIEYYESHEEFHDWSINEIKMEFFDKAYFQTAIKISYAEVVVKLSFNKVVQTNFSLDYSGHSWGEEWLYSEFIVDENNLLNFSVLTSSGAEYDIVFEDLLFEVVKNNY